MTQEEHRIHHEERHIE